MCSYAMRTYCVCGSFAAEVRRPSSFGAFLGESPAQLATNKGGVSLDRENLVDGQ